MVLACRCCRDACPRPKCPAGSEAVCVVSELAWLACRAACAMVECVDHLQPSWSRQQRYGDRPPRLRIPPTNGADVTGPEASTRPPQHAGCSLQEDLVGSGLLVGQRGEGARVHDVGVWVDLSSVKYRLFRLKIGLVFLRCCDYTMHELPETTP